MLAEIVAATVGISRIILLFPQVLTLQLPHTSVSWVLHLGSDEAIISCRWEDSDAEDCKDESGVENLVI